MKIRDKTIVIIGKTGCGKSITKKILTKIEKFDSILEHTNRPIREGEKNGLDYIFETKEEMIRKIDHNEFVCWSKYEATFGDAYYGALPADFKPNSVFLTNPDNLKMIQDSELRDRLFTVYINVDESSRAIKLLQRGDTIDEVYRRIASEREQFKDIEKRVDLVINNKYYHRDILNVVSKILEYK